MKPYDIHENIEVKESPGKGKSLFAKRDFKKDEIVFVAFGKIVDYHTDYTIPIDHDLMIEPRTPEGNLVQYICHSCEPNVGIQDRSLFVAMRDIAQGEEIVTNYAFLGYEFGKEMNEDGQGRKAFDRTCRCGTKSCKGTMQAYKDLDPEEREKHRNYISDYLLDDEKYPYNPE